MTKARVSGVTRDSGLFVLGSERSVSGNQRARQRGNHFPAVDREAVGLASRYELEAVRSVLLPAPFAARGRGVVVLERVESRPGVGVGFEELDELCARRCGARCCGSWWAAYLESHADILRMGNERAKGSRHSDRARDDRQRGERVTDAHAEAIQTAADVLDFVRATARRRLHGFELDERSGNY